MSGTDREATGRIVFLMPVVSQVRFHKRVEGLMHQGWESTALAFERRYFTGKDPAFPVTRLGRIDSGRYGKRTWCLLKALPTVVRQVAKADVVYAFGLDMAALGVLAKVLLRTRAPVIYEVGDIRQALLESGVASGMLRGLDRWVCRRANLVVATSDGYVRGYFMEVLGFRDRTKFVVVENKLPQDYSNLRSLKAAEPDSDGVLRIGYFGLLRCPRALDILLRAAHMGEGRIQILIRGYPFDSPDLEERVKGLDWIEFGGPYVSPTELPDLYGRVDLVWACYPYQGSGTGNWTWARTNRFYEACGFGVPVLSSAGSDEARIVTELGIGMAIDLDEPNRAVETLVGLDGRKVAEWEARLERLDSRVYLDVGDHLALSRRIREQSCK